MAESEPIVEQKGLPKVPMLPPAVAVPVEGALGAVGGLASVGLSQVARRGSQVTQGMRPWLEFLDFSAFGLASGGTNEYLSRYRANLQWFFLNYIMVGLGMAAVSEITKPVSLIGALLLLYVYFQLFGANAEGQDEVRFLGLMLSVTERTGFMLLLGILVFYCVSSGMEIFVAVAMGTLVISVVHGCLRRPHPDAVSGNDDPSSAASDNV